MFLALGINRLAHDRASACARVSLPRRLPPWTSLQDGGTVSRTGRCRALYLKTLASACSPRNHRVSVSILGLADHNTTGKNQMQCGLQDGSAAGKRQEMALHRNRVSDTELRRALGFSPPVKWNRGGVWMCITDAEDVTQALISFIVTFVDWVVVGFFPS